MSDYIVRATAANGEIRAFAATTRELTEESRRIHNTSPVGSAAMGRLLTGAAIMGTTMKNEKDLLSIIINADGPMGKLGVTADSFGNVKGYIGNPLFQNPPNYFGKLDVGGAIGNGTLKVIKDLGLKEPYIGQSGLITGEIAEDLTYYYAMSEQIPTSIALGVLMNKDNTVKQSGGFMIQLLPFASEEVIGKLEENLKEITSVTSLLDEGLTPEGLLKRVLKDFDVVINDRIETAYKCNCSRERVSKALISVGRKELNDMIEEGKEIEMCCHFCNKKYIFSVEDLKGFLA